MAYNNTMKILILFCVTFVYSICGVSNANHLPYKAIFNFGDSISDTGNEASLHPPIENNSPYGSTYFKHPSGRLSNGRLIIDFIADAYGLPFLPAYKTLTEGQDVTKGVNFAFSGSTALNYNNHVNKSGIRSPEIEKSLSGQLKMFKNFTRSLCKSKKDCRSYFKKSLFLVGEIGGNDLFSHFSPNFSNFRGVVPSVVDAITKTTTTLIKAGAVEIVVPGNFPIGCGASLLALATGYGNKTENYDEFGCFKAFNTIAEYFNDKLIYSINTLRENYPNVKIIYFDYYNAAKRLYEAPQQYGFDKNAIFKACCGAGGSHNFHPKIGCGSSNATVCSDPSKYINWDGVHLTEAAYRQIAKGLVEGPFANPPLKPAPFKIA